MTDTQLAVRPKASQQLATLIGMEPNAMLDVIKAQCFKGNPQNITDAQLAAFVSIAVEMGVNPLLPGMLYAFPVQGGGIVPMMGPDGVYKKLSEHPGIDSWETTVFPEDVSLPPTHATTKIFRNGRERPLSYTAILSEWKVNSNPNWNSRPRHMLAIRSLKQCARQIIHGVPYDEDERVIMGEVNVTGNDVAPEPALCPAPPVRAKKGAAAVIENAAPKTEPKTQTIDVEASPASPDAEKAHEIAKVLKFEAKETPQGKVKEPVIARTSLNDKEEATFIVKVDKIYALVINVAGKLTPSVQANVIGEFNGTVYHFGGATETSDGLQMNDPWHVSSTLTLDVFGRLNAKTGKVMVVVKSVAEVSPETPAVEVE
jgi:hypothetical protein